MINVTRTFLPPIQEYLSQLERVWSSGWVTNRGELTLELEDKLKEYLNISNLLIVNNGTIALQISIKALALKGDIITTPFSYVATTSSIVWEGCRPIFVDIHPEYLTIDETKIERAITDDTCAILATHVYGNPCAVETLEEIAKRHKLKLIYDAAHCFGVRYKGQSILNAGTISTLSFHATKLFHTGEGGGIVCNDEAFAHRVFYSHNFGHNGPEEFFGLGINGKISEVNAALGLAVLPHMKTILLKRKSICEGYDEYFAEADIQTIRLRHGTEWNYSYYPILVSSEIALKRLQSALEEKAIFPRRYFHPTLNRLPYCPGKIECPVAEDVSSRVLCLPLYEGLAESSMSQISELVLRSL